MSLTLTKICQFLSYIYFTKVSFFFFFKIWVYTSIILIIIINRAHWPNMHTCTIQLGLSSSQTKKSSTFTACWASAWAWAFAFLLVCEKAKVRKPWTHWSIPLTTFWTDGSISFSPLIALLRALTNRPQTANPLRCLPPCLASFLFFHIPQQIMIVRSKSPGRASSHFWRKAQSVEWIERPKIPSL